ncbi:cytochrome C oxidase subunit III [Corallococcus sicarius]|uniref:Cytochrome C oxidase subunit III n=1 Tax=Corallococcus sicarius TaxID=2316726 RepID=A0A3A8MM44_9BACT|nr:cytochrome C oxidase subunit III [Corallococcus sicarius]RKH33093.1 cytochrome C oxidase subunit III [Corallococcus sicarius]
MSTNDPTGTLTSASPQRAEANLWFGVVLAHAAAVMLFCAVAFAANFYRMRGFWPPATALPGGFVPAVAGVLLLTGGALLHGALRHASGPRPARAWHLGVLGAGAGFLATQAAWLHVLWWHRDLRIPESGVFASALYGLSAVQAAHAAVVLMGVLRATLHGMRGLDARARLRRAVPGWWCTTVMYGVLFAVVYLP